MNDTDRYLTLAQGVSAHAQAGTLHPDVAVRFCQAILPALLVEWELCRRVDQRLGQMFPVVPQQPQASITEPVPAKAKKKAVKKSRKTKKGVKDDRSSS